MADYLAENLLAGFGKSLTSGNSRFRKSIPSERSARPLKTCWDCGGTWNKRSKKRLPDPHQRALRRAPERLLRKLPPHAMLPTLRQNRGRHPKLRQPKRSEEHTSELQSHSDLVCRLLLEKKKKKKKKKKKVKNKKERRQKQSTRIHKY